MAEVVVSGVQFSGEQAEQTRFAVRVTVNNKEWVGPAGFADPEIGGLIGSNPAVCGGETFNSGHDTNVTLEIRRHGNAVFEETKDICATAQKFSDAVTGNDSVEFSVPGLPEGEYRVYAKAKVKGSGQPTDRWGPRALNVADTDTSGYSGIGGTDPDPTPVGGTSPNPSRTTGGSSFTDLLPGGGGGGGGGRRTGGGGGGPLITAFTGSDPLNKAMFIVALVAVAWIFASAAEVAA